GLDEIHQKGLIYCDFHHGNILNIRKKILSISDLGLCKPVEYFQSFKNNNIYGVLPFVTPEVLRGQPYTLANDIYRFSMIMWEFIYGIPPFDNEAHDFLLALHICKGKRPKIIKNIPQCYINLLKKCWDMDLL
ncbi:6109_t:CDS:1, partial [Funneliformis geosporum]